jgi:hypothetical protein
MVRLCGALGTLVVTGQQRAVPMSGTIPEAHVVYHGQRVYIAWPAVAIALVPGLSEIDAQKHLPLVASRLNARLVSGRPRPLRWASPYTEPPQHRYYLEVMRLAMQLIAPRGSGPVTPAAPIAMLTATDGPTLAEDG